MYQAQKQKEWFKDCLNNKDLVEKIKKIKLIISDVDGALTNGLLYITETTNDQENYKELRTKGFSTQDGFATGQITKNKLLLVALLSGRPDQTTKIRAKMLGIPEDLCYIGICKNKPEKVKIMQEKNNISAQETIHFGDDFLDIEIKPHVGLLACPLNTPFYFHNQADILIPLTGENNAFRLLLDLILYIQNKHFAQKIIEDALK
ncbi:hypothetical protein KAT08_01620 [Candidatus Babeliales bacterium]|nr:hypothetical protein [Candidatus Babeliales bacterium]